MAKNENTFSKTLKSYQFAGKKKVASTDGEKPGKVYISFVLYEGDELLSKLDDLAAERKMSINQLVKRLAIEAATA